VIYPVSIDSHTTVHFICASAFFLTLAAMSFFLFTKTNPKEEPKLPKRIRNGIYRVCGIGIAISISTIGAGFWIFKMSDTNTLTFWCETTSLIFFGTAWLIKGETFFKD
jgi:hypothetical protein